MGPFHLPAPPYESVYTSPERLVMQESTLQVRQKYAQVGLRIEHPGQPEDHIALELEFMEWACRRMLEAPGEGEERRALRIQTTFFREHLARWVLRFCNDVYRSAETDLFKGLACLCRGFMAMEGDLLSEPLCAQEAAR